MYGKSTRKKLEEDEFVRVRLFLSGGGGGRGATGEWIFYPLYPEGGRVGRWEDLFPPYWWLSDAGYLKCVFTHLLSSVLPELLNEKDTLDFQQDLAKVFEAAEMHEFGKKLILHDITWFKEKILKVFFIYRYCLVRLISKFYHRKRWYLE